MCHIKRDFCATFRTEVLFFFLSGSIFLFSRGRFRNFFLFLNELNIAVNDFADFFKFFSCYALNRKLLAIISLDEFLDVIITSFCKFGSDFLIDTRKISND